MKFKIRLINKGCKSNPESLEIVKMVTNSYQKYKTSFSRSRYTFFTDDLSLAKRIKGSLGSYSKNFKGNFSVDIYIKLHICGEIQYFSITNKIRRENDRR